MEYNSAKRVDNGKEILADANRITWKEKRKAIFSHFSTFFTYGIALSPLSLESAAVVNLIMPALLWLVRRPSYASEQAKEAGLFQVLLAVAFFSLSHLKTDIGFSFWVFTVIGVVILHTVNFLTVSAFISLAKDFRYPLSPFAYLYELSQRRKEGRLAGVHGAGSVDYLHQVQDKLGLLLIGLGHKIREFNDPDLQAKLKDLSDRIETISNSLKRNPIDLTVHRPFFNYYPDATLDILNRYNQLSGHFQEEGKQIEYKTRVLDTLGSLDSAFTKFEKNLLSKESMNLETEMAVIEKTLELDGLK
jgi:uncharacterized Tic20 family protein